MQGVIIIKSSGESLPKDFLARALEKYTTCFGVCAVHAEAPCLFVGRMRQENMKLDDLHKIIEGQKDRDLLIYLGQVGEGEQVFADDFQPFTLLEDADGAAILVAALDGDFTEFAKADSAHSAESFCVQEDLLERARQIYKYHDGDLKATIDELISKRHSREIRNLMVGNRGSVVLFSANGDIPAFTAIDDPTAREYPWGWVSNHLDYEVKSEPKADPLQKLAQELSGGTNVPDQKTIPPTVEPAATAATSVPRTGGLRRPGRAGAQAPVEPKPDVVAAAPVPSGNDKQADVPVAAFELKQGQLLKIIIPSNLKNDVRKLTKWIRKRMPGGQLPPDATNLNAFEVPLDAGTPKAAIQTYLEQNKMQGLTALGGTVQTAELEQKKEPLASSRPPGVVKAEEFKPKGLRRPGAATQQPAKPVEPVPEKQPEPEQQPETQPQKDTTPHYITPEGQEIKSPPIPVIPAVAKAAANAYLESDYVKKTLDNHSRIIKDPTGFEVMEQQAPPFPKQVPIIKDLDDVFYWSYPIFHGLGKVSVDALAVLAFNLACLARKQAEELTAPESEKEAAPLQQSAPSTSRKGLIRPGRSAA